MKSVVVWIRQTRKTEVELSFERDALRIYALPNFDGNISRNLSINSNVAENSGSTTTTTAALLPHLNLLATIAFADVVGCHRMKGRSTDDRTSYFTVYAYSLRGSSDNTRLDSYIQSSANAINRGSASVNEGLASITNNNSGSGASTTSASGSNFSRTRNTIRRSGRRERRCFTFQIQGKYVYEDNSAYVKNWVDAIRARITDTEPPHLKPLGLYRDVQNRQRRLYVLVNPHSGPGRALDIFQDRVMPVFAEANVACRLVVTERANHAQDLVRNLNLNEWDGIVIVSGDGLLYEVINGLAKRPDHERALRIPIGAIPGGSGNALAAATCLGPSEVVKGDFAVDTAVMIARPIYRSMRLIRVEMRKHRIFSFISVGWGLLSDIDIESEKFRRTLGSARFTAGACIRVLNLRRYRARISYVPADNVVPVAGSTLSGGLMTNGRTTGTATKNQNGFTRMQSEGGVGLQGNSNTRSLNFEDEGQKIGRAGQVQRAKSMSPFGAGRSSQTDLVEEDDGPDLVAATPSSNPSRFPFQVRFDLESTNNLNALSTPTNPTADNNDLLNDERRADLVPMPKIDEPVPADWLVIEDELVLFYAVYLNHIGAEAPYMPPSRLDDECIYLTLVRTSAVTRTQLVKFLFAIEHAEHINMPFFEVIPAKAFRLDRLSEGPSDIVAVDGELIKDVEGPIQACVSKYTTTVMTAR